MGQCVSANKKAEITTVQKTKSNPQIPAVKQKGPIDLPIIKDERSASENIINPIKPAQQKYTIPSVIDIQKVYRQKLKQEVMGFVTDLPNSLFKAGTNASQSKINKISKQITKFTQFLPCEHTNAIFVRCDQNRMDSMNVLISGSKGTPYANGLYHFQLFADDTFPNAPPKMQLLTGKGKVRFNPNLYINGYICLSLLGTWPGNPEQSWSPSSSTLAQIFVSIQSMVMNNDIYFNEPGLQSMKGSLKGKLLNQGYSNVVKIANIRHAMIQIIKKPPKGFQKVVKDHFLVKKSQIIKECSEWLEQSNKPYQNCGQNPTFQGSIGQSFGFHLQKEIDQLISTLSTLKDE